jgi:hypothetical protein
MIPVPPGRRDAREPAGGAPPAPGNHKVTHSVRAGRARRGRNHLRDPFTSGVPAWSSPGALGGKPSLTHLPFERLRRNARATVSARLAGGCLTPWTTPSARASVPEAIDEVLSRHRLIPRGGVRTRATRQGLPGRCRLAMSAFATSVLLHEAVGHAAERSRRQQAIPGCPPVTASGGTQDWDDLGFPVREQRLTASQAPAPLDPRGILGLYPSRRPPAGQVHHPRLPSIEPVFPPSSVRSTSSPWKPAAPRHARCRQRRRPVFPGGRGAPPPD